MKKFFSDHICYSISAVYYFVDLYFNLVLIYPLVYTVNEACLSVLTILKKANKQTKIKLPMFRNKYN